MLGRFGLRVMGDSGYWLLGTGYWVLDAGCRVLDV